MAHKIYRVSFDDFLQTEGGNHLNLKQALNNLSSLVVEWQKDVDQSVLVDLRRRPPSLTIEDVRELVRAIAATGLGYFNRVAVVYNQHPGFDEMKFLESLAIELGMDLRAFDNYEDALHWLPGQKSLVHSHPG